MGKGVTGQQAGGGGGGGHTKTVSQLSPTTASFYEMLADIAAVEHCHCTGYSDSMSHNHIQYPLTDNYNTNLQRTVLCTDSITAAKSHFESQPQTAS